MRVGTFVKYIGDEEQVERHYNVAFPSPTQDGWGTYLDPLLYELEQDEKLVVVKAPFRVWAHVYCHIPRLDHEVFVPVSMLKRRPA